MLNRKLLVSLLLALTLVVTGGVNNLFAADAKIGAINIQQVLLSSKDGMAAKKKVDVKMMEYKEKFSKEEQEIMKLQEEIRNKSSVWPEDVKTSKDRALQKRMQEVELESKYATNEVKDLEKKSFAPILEKLKNVIAAFGKKEGFTLILQARSGVLYIDESVDISDKIAAEMHK